MPDSKPKAQSLPPLNLPYRGRFAPSPTGPLHLGSLIAALASYLDARSNGGTWLVRMDDLDPPREIPGAAQSILDSLQQHGLHWDEDVLWQSQRHAAYRRALEQLATRTFNCDCSRATLGPGGTCQRACQSRQGDVTSPSSTRIAVPDDFTIEFNDRLQGPQNIALGRSSSNFIVHRKDGLYAYQLAVVVDDAHQSITHIVRGCDLLDTTARQQFLQQLLGHTTPQYCHVPVITNVQGQKYSKQHHAAALENKDAANNLRQALAFLGQSSPPVEMNEPGDILALAVRNWRPQLIPAVMAIPDEQ